MPHGPEAVWEMGVLEIQRTGCYEVGAVPARKEMHVPTHRRAIPLRFLLLITPFL